MIPSTPLTKQLVNSLSSEPESWVYLSDVLCALQGLKKELCLDLHPAFGVCNNCERCYKIDKWFPISQSPIVPGVKK